MFGGSEFAEGIRRMLPLTVAGVLEGAAFGALAVGVMGHAAPVAMSLTAYSGGAQYATVSVLAGGGTLGAGLLSAAALNVRYLAMSAMVPGRTRRQRAAACLLLSDAAWAVADGSRQRLLGAGAIDWVGWTLGTAIGVFGGGILGDPTRFGLDAAFPALFLWLLRDRLGSTALIAAALTVALIPLVPPGLPVLIAGVAGAAWGMRR